MVKLKQDRTGVRTAQDLERKYDFAGMKKAVKMQEEGLNKTNKTLETFINATLKSNANIQSQTDGQITTWFSNGEPTLDSEPTVYWVTDEQKESHIGDLYYDRDTGNAYEYMLEEGEYKWGIITDSETIEALAIANSVYDTKDNERRVFVTTPYPPYDNGDLWFDGTDIFICQISKSAVNMETGEAEVYAEGDFIIATKYTDNTIANQVGDELKVLEGTVLQVIESADEFKVEVRNKDTNTQGQIDLINQALSTLIKGAEGESLMTQTETGWEFSIASLISTVNKTVSDIEGLEGVNEQTVSDLKEVKNALVEVEKVTAYFSFTEIEGEPHLTLGTSKNGFKGVYTNKGVHFLVGDDIDTPHTYIDYDTLNIERAIVHEELQIGGFLIKERDNGNVGFVWRGEDE